MRVRPTTPAALTEELADAVEAVRAPWVRVAVDGAPGSGTAETADAVAESLRVRGRDTVRVRMDDYLRAASVRLEFGHHDPDSYYTTWFDHNGLTREVLRPLTAGGSGSVVPALWDSTLDRSPRRARVELQRGGVALVDGPLLLGAGLDFDLGVHLWLPGGALARRLPEELHWALPAFSRYNEEVHPEALADHTVRTDRPGHPAVVDAF